MNKSELYDTLFRRTDIDQYYCYVCKSRISSKEHHERESTHQTRYREVQNIRENCKRKWNEAFNDDFENKIVQIKDNSSKKEICGLFYEQIFDTSIRNVNHEVKWRLLDMYNLEIITALGLCMWKHLCMNNVVDDGSRRSMIFWKAWMEGGWKVTKEEIKPSLKIALQQVREFLDFDDD